jgi:hypothetical protein
MSRLTIKTVTVSTTLMMMTFSATAATITISDLLDGNPIVTTSADLTGAETALTFEKAVISGLLPAGVQLPVGTRSVILTEPAGDPFGPPQSDFITLTVGAAAPTFSITFESDGAVNFASDVAALAAGTPTVLEDGTFQNLSTALNSVALGISVQSDLTPSPEPEPAGWLLLLSGLLLISVAYIRRKRTAEL